MAEAEMRDRLKRLASSWSIRPVRIQHRGFHKGWTYSAVLAFGREFHRTGTRNSLDLTPPAKEKFPRLTSKAHGPQSSLSACRLNPKVSELLLQLEKAIGGSCTQGTQKPLSVKRVYERMKALGRRAGVANAHPHRLRDTFAVDMLARWASPYDVAKLPWRHHQRDRKALRPVR